MLKEACNATLPLPVCFSPNYTVPWDSHRSLFQVTQDIYNIGIIFFGAPITCVGLVTSFLCCILFIRYDITQKSTSRLLIVNSAVDTLYLAALMFSRLLCDILPLGDFKNNYINILDGVGNFLVLFRNYTIVIIAFERFVLICYPVKFKTKSTNQWTKRALIAAGVGTIIIRTPTVLTVIFENLHLCHIAATCFAIDAFADILFFTIIPLILLSVFTILIFLQTQRLIKWRKQRGISDNGKNMAFDRMKKRVHITIMIVLITFTVLEIPFLPNGVTRMLVALGDATCMVYLARNITAAMAYVGALLNSTINFFIYLVTWPKFRTSLEDLSITVFTCSCGKRSKPKNSRRGIGSTLGTVDDTGVKEQTQDLDE